MSFVYHLQKVKASHLRKLPCLPRFGVIVDMGGYEFSCKFAPLIEAIASLPDRGFTKANLKRIIKSQLAEIQFRPHKENEVIETSAKQL